MSQKCTCHVGPEEIVPAKYRTWLANKFSTWYFYYKETNGADVSAVAGRQFSHLALPGQGTVGGTWQTDVHDGLTRMDIVPHNVGLRRFVRTRSQLQLCSAETTRPRILSFLRLAEHRGIGLVQSAGQHV